MLAQNRERNFSNPLRKSTELVLGGLAYSASRKLCGELCCSYGRRGLVNCIGST